MVQPLGLKNIDLQYYNLNNTLLKPIEKDSIQLSILY